MTQEEFNNLNLMEVFKENNMLKKNKKGIMNTPVSTKACLDYLSTNIGLVDPFTSIEEMLFCVLQNDWPLNHMCNICGNRIMFSMGSGGRYPCFCSKECTKQNRTLNIANVTVPEDVLSDFKESYSFEEFRNFLIEKMKFNFNKSFSPKNNNLLKQLSSKLIIAKEWRSIEEFIWCVKHNDNNPHRYCVCGKEVTFTEQYGRNKTCGDIVCKEATAHTDNAYKKKENTCLQRYGATHFSKTSEYKEKYEATSLLRYGATNFMKSSDALESLLEKNFERTGYRSPFANPEVQDKIKKTVQKKIEENPDYYTERFEKTKKTWSENDPGFVKRVEKTKKTIEENIKNNPDYWKEISTRSFQTKYTQAGSKELYDAQCEEKRIATLLSKYGSLENYFELRNKKTRDTYLQEYGQPSYRNTPEWAEKDKILRAEQYEKFRKDNPDIFSLLDLTELAKDVFIKYSLTDCRKLIIVEASLLEMNLPVESFNFGNGDNSKKFRGCRISDVTAFMNIFNEIVERKCKAFFVNSFRSESEKELFNYVKSLVGTSEVISSDRSIIRDDSHSLELDIYLPSYNLAIEFNGCYWHSFERLSDKNYHLNKTLMCEQRGIRLIHIWDYEWLFEQEKIKAFLENILCKKENIGARVCTLKKINLEEEKDFLNTYHLQGYKKSLICYGLYYKEELVQLMSFCYSRYRKNIQYELLRLCTKHGYNIIGGAEKLLNHFLKENSPESIISYCNRDKFTGEVYTRLGFTGNSLHPNAFYIKIDNKGYQRFTAASLNRAGADKLIGTHEGIGSNNRDVVLRNNFLEVYDVGQQSYEMHLPKTEFGIT